MEQTVEPRERKVRIACQRCRERRIKCDGKAPSCSKCEKAGVQCIDVSTVASVGSVPRGLLSDALARVAWLEDLVKARLPDVDLTSESPQTTVGLTGAETARPSSNVGQVQHVSSKRRATETGLDHGRRTVDHGSRMALDLGLISLNASNSRMHYLGASSGHFFADLLQGNGESNCASNDQSAESSDLDEGPATDSTNDTAWNRAFAVLEQLRTVLPKQEECNRLVRLFFHYYHPDYPVLHQPSIQALVTALYDSINAQSPNSLQANGWLKDNQVSSYNGQLFHNDGLSSMPLSTTSAGAQLLYILAIAAHLQNHKHRFGADPHPYEDLAIQLMSRTLGDVSLESVQLIVLSVLHGFISGKSGNPWVFLHLGMAYAVDLGLHRRARDSCTLSPEAIQMRRRVFFCLYELDRFISSVQGRPLGFQDDTLELTLPSRLHDDGNHSTPEDQVLMDYSIARFQWAKLISEIKYRFYRFSSGATPTSVRSETQIDIHSRLDQWISDALQQLNTVPDKRLSMLKIKLQINYEYAVCLLYQPSLGCRNPGSAALQRCFDSAKQRLNLYWSLHEHDALTMSWPVIHGIFASGTTLLFCIWACQQVRASMATTQVSKDLRLCTNLLTLGSMWWAPARRCGRSFQSLVDMTTDAFLLPTKSTTAPVPDPHTTPASLNSFDAPELETDAWEHADIEEMLRSFMQNDYQFADMFGSFPTDFSDQYYATSDFDIPSM